MTSEEQKGVLFVMTFYSFIFWLILPQSILEPLKVLVPFAPLILYGVVGSIFMRTYLRQSIPITRQPELDRQQSASLTLSGFCFTSLSLLASFFKDEIKKGDSEPSDIIFFFGCALVAFIASYTILRFRIRTVADFISDALVDNGLWCILAGMWTFFYGRATPKIAFLFFAMLIFYFFYVARNLFYYARFSMRTPALKSHGA
jgi:hypothetical protein